MILVHRIFCISIIQKGVAMGRRAFFKILILICASNVNTFSFGSIQTDLDWVYGNNIPFMYSEISPNLIIDYNINAGNIIFLKIGQNYSFNDYYDDPEIDLRTGENIGYGYGLRLGYRKIFTYVTLTSGVEYFHYSSYKIDDKVRESLERGGITALEGDLTSTGNI